MTQLETLVALFEASVGQLDASRSDPRRSADLVHQANRLKFEQGRLQFTLAMAQSGELQGFLAEGEDASVIAARCLQAEEQLQTAMGTFESMCLLASHVFGPLPARPQGHSMVRPGR